MLTAESFIMPMEGTQEVEVSGNKTRSVTTELNSLAKQMVQDLYVKLTENNPGFYLPVCPMHLFSKEEVESIKNHKKRIFYSYFCEDDVNLLLDFGHQEVPEYPDVPANFTEDCLFAIYCLKKGKDNEVNGVLEQDMRFHLFTFPQAFDAIYRPHKPPLKITSVQFSNNQAICTLEQLDNNSKPVPFQSNCIDLLDKLHGEELLHTVTDYITDHPEFFLPNTA